MVEQVDIGNGAHMSIFKLQHVVLASIVLHVVDTVAGFIFLGINHAGSIMSARAAHNCTCLLLSQEQQMMLDFC
jgi:hypothetical protein